ncbi:MAG: c-type cytochrome biogenesis protein CcmI [Betaproteobacteria bacterium]|nr:c-type cytochrome biogenesis protein CcmI [Betaproteobacteria bacterium]
MLTFWIVAALLIVAALAFVLVPLLRPRAISGPTLRDANLAVLRGQRQEIEADVSVGLLAKDARESALAELASRAEEDLATAAEAPAGPYRRPWAVAGFFALLIPAVAVGFYLWVGTPEATDPKLLAAAATATPGDHQIEEMVAALEQKMKEQPDDVQGWMLLARSFAATGKTEKALAAYAHLAKIAPQEASVLADYADALGASRGRNLAGEPTELVMRALQVDPRHPKALALAASAKLNSGDFAESLAYWERLYAVVPPGSEDAAEVRNVIEDVRSRAAAAGKPQPPSKILAAAPATLAPAAPAKAPASMPPTDAAPAKAAAVAGKSVSGTVRLADALAGKTAPTDTLFIYARAETGSRIPLAIIRGGAGELPRAFELDDSMGMSPAVKLSTTPSVVIEARVSKAGGAVIQPGDLVGTSKPVAPGAKAVAIVIDRVVP